MLGHAQDVTCRDQPTQVPVYIYTGAIQRRSGLDNPLYAVFGAFSTRDSRVMFLALTQGQWSSLLAWMAETGDADPWMLDPALLPMAARTAPRERIHTDVVNLLGSLADKRLLEV